MLKNSFFMLLSTAVRLLANLVVFILMAHVWGPEVFGIFMYPLTLATVLVKVVDYGFVLQLVRDVGRSPARVHEITGSALGSKLLLLVPLLGIALALTPVLPAERGYRALFWLLLADQVVNSFGMCLNFPLRALGRFDREAWVATWLNLALFVLVGALVFAGYGPVVVAIGFVAARAAYLAASWVIYSRVAAGVPRIPRDRRVLLDTLKRGFPFGVHISIAALSMQADTLIVQHYMGAESVGIYQAGMRLLVGGLVVADALNNVYLAAMARAGNDNSELTRLGTRMTRHLLAVGAAGFAVVVATADWLVHLVYGAEYARLAQLLPLFGLILFIRYGGVSYGTLLTLADRQTFRMLAVAGAFVLSLALNVSLVPRFGLHGALAAAIAGNLILYGVYITATRMELRSFMADWRSKAIVSSIVISAMLVTFLGLHNTSLKVQLSVVLLLLSLLVGVTRREWNALSQRLVKAF